MPVIDGIERHGKYMLVLIVIMVLAMIVYFWVSDGCGKNEVPPPPPQQTSSTEHFQAEQIVSLFFYLLKPSLLPILRR